MDHSNQGDNTSPGYDMGGGDDMSGHSMQMYFHASPHATILFKGWQTMTYVELFASALAILIFSCLYEGLRVWKKSLLKSSRQKRSAQATKYQSSGQVKETESKSMTSNEPLMGDKDLTMKEALFSSTHLIQVFLHTIQLFFSYCLMLIFMTYNIYLCLALVIGGGLGFWLFAWRTGSDTDDTDENEHCN